MGIDIQSLGFTQEELQQRVVDACVQRVFEITSMDEEGFEFTDQSPLAKRLEAAVRGAIDAKVSEIAEKHILPLTTKFIENVTLQETNKWGEKTGKSMTFIEYLIQRAEAYLLEDVDFQGRAKSAADSYSWKKAQTRLTHMVHEHLHYSIDSAMKTAVANANAVIVGGIQDTVKTKLGEIARALKVSVATK